MTNAISSIASTPFTGLATQSYTVPTTGIYTVSVAAQLPWITPDQPAYGTPTEEVQTVVTVADSAGSLNSTYFTFYTAGNSQFLVSGTYYQFFYVWLNINSAGVDPAPANGYGIQVTAATNATNTTIATNIKTAINAVAGIPVLATLSGHTVTIANTQLGSCTAAADGTAATGFTFAVTTAGAYGGTSGLNVLIKKNSTVVQQLANPTPTQTNLSGQQTFQCTAADTISVVTASTAAVDNLPNAIKGIINVFPGPV